MKRLATEIRKAIIAAYDIPDQEDVVYTSRDQSFSMLIYYPVKGENNELLIITAGLVDHLKGNTENRGELILIVDTTNETVIKESVDFVKVFGTYLIKRSAAIHNAAIFNDIPSYANMSSVFVYRDTIYNGIAIGEGDIFINYYNVIPLYDNETLELKLIPDKVKPSLIEELWQKHLIKTNRPSHKIIPLAIDSIWNAIVEWHKKHGTFLSKELNRKKSEYLANNKINELRIPEDLKYFSSKLTTNLSVSDYQLLTRNQIYDNWKMMEDLWKTGKIQSWDSYWIPFAEDSGGNFILIDGTTKEQKIIYLENEGPYHTNISGFFDWLFCYKNDLYSNKYEIDDEGFLYHK